jgi:Family of unknown function (DUF6788)
MRMRDHPTVQRRALDARVKQLQARGPVLAASLVEIGRRCGRPGCRCTRGELHMGHYLTRSVEGKTQTIYVPVDLVDEVRAWVDEYQRLRALIQESTQLALARIRGHVTARKHRAGRP